MSTERIMRRHLVILIGALLAQQGGLHAQQRTAARRPGTLVVAHGGSAAWNEQVRGLVRQVRTGGPVEVSFLMGDEAKAARFQDGARRLVEAGASEIIIVPLLVSSHSGHFDQVRYLAGEIETLDSTMLHHLHVSGIDRARVRVPLRVAPALDDSPELAHVLAERADALALNAREQALFLLGHGPNSAEDHAAWMGDLRSVADSVQKFAGFRDVKIGLLADDAPAPVRNEAVRRIREIIDIQHELTGRPVVVVPVLIARGALSQATIPDDLTSLTITYSGEALLPHDQMARWIERRVTAATGSQR